MIRCLWLILLCGFAVACSQTAEAPETGQNDSPAPAEEHEEHEEEEEHDEEHEDDEHREHEAHEHGAALLTIAWSGNQMVIELETPAFNILGFEHAPETTAEEQLLEDSLALLQAGSLLQILSPEAECAVTEAVVHTTLDEEATEHDGEGEHEEDETETHSDIDVAYNIFCQNPEHIEQLDAGELFARFPNFEELRAQWVSDTQQSAKDLTPDDPLLLLE